MCWIGIFKYEYHISVMLVVVICCYDNYEWTRGVQRALRYCRLLDGCLKAKTWAGREEMIFLLGGRNGRAVHQGTASWWHHKDNRIFVSWARDISSYSPGKWKGLCPWRIQRGAPGQPRAQWPSGSTLRCLDPLLVPLGGAPAGFLLASSWGKLRKGKFLGYCKAHPIWGLWLIQFFSFIYYFVSP